MQRHGEATTQAAQTAVGKCARVAQVVPTAKPFSAALWAALTGALHASGSGKAGVSPGYVPTARFFVAAAWLDAFIQGSIPDGQWPLGREVHPMPDHLRRDRADVHFEFDAPPWGSGAIPENDTISFRLNEIQKV